MHDANYADWPDPTPVASHFVDGEYVESEGGETIPLVFSGTGETIANVHAATPDVVETAVASAARAQVEWAKRSGAERGQVLLRAADIVRARNHELSQLETLDTGKPIQETLVADAASGADALAFFGGIAGEIAGTSHRFGDDFAMTERKPLGVCVGIGAWNYPTQIACWKAAPALAAGNAMVFKPSEMTPLCALQVAEIFLEAGLPPGVFNVVQGKGAVGEALVTDPRVAKVSLTGSVPTGKRVYQAAAASLKSVTMELGGKSPIIVFADADIERAVSGVILGNFYSSGQICSNGTRIFIHRDIKDAFIDRLCARLRDAVIGDPRDPTTSFGPMVSQAQGDSVMQFIAQGREDGARLVCGGNRLDRPGTFIAPTVFADVTDDMTIARDEIFGPVASLLDFEDETDVIARANKTPFGLAAGVFTSDLSRAHRVIDQLHAGTCWINTYNLTPAGLPFGGSKQSGFGRENARAALDAYTEFKSIYVGIAPVEAPF